jgi:hypothetical protein
MTAPAPRFGEGPTSAERLDVVEKALAEALARIAVLESARDVAEEADGPVPGRLPPNWKPIKAAASQVGYSEAGLRKAIKRHAGGPQWWRYLCGRLFVDVDRCPRPVRT